MAGGVGGRRDVMMLLAGGIGVTSKRAFVGGTLSANPLSCAAGCFAIQEMQRTNAAVKAGHAGDRLRKGSAKLSTGWDFRSSPTTKVRLFTCKPRACCS